MQSVKRRILLLGLCAFVSAGAVCSSPTMPPLPPADNDPEPTNPDGGDDQGAFLFGSEPLYLA